MERSKNDDRAFQRPLMGDDSAMGPIREVREGMRVVDSTGDELGHVDLVKMGDPEAITVQESQDDSRGILSDLANAFRSSSEPDLPEPLRSQLLRNGFIRVDGKGWIDTDRYVAADYIGSVAGDTVTLTLPKEQILETDAGR